MFYFEQLPPPHAELIVVPRASIVATKICDFLNVIFKPAINY